MTFAGDRRLRAAPARVGFGGLAVLLAWALCACNGGLSLATGLDRGASMIRYSVRTDRPWFLVGEDILIHVEVENASDREIHFPDPTHPASPQPVHRLQAPGSDQSVSFNGRVTHEARPEGSADGVPTVSVEAGARWQNRFRLADVVKTSRPGVYELESTLETDAGALESEPLRFEIRSVAVAQASLGFGSRPLGVGEGEGAFVQGGAAGVSLYTFLYREVAAAIGESKITATIHRSELPAGAADPRIPVRNAPFDGDPIRWVAWREGASVHAKTTTGVDAVVALPAQPSDARLVHPAYRAAEGPARVLALSKDDRNLDALSFDLERGSFTAEARSEWSLALPARAERFALALVPGGADRAAIALASSVPGGVALHLGAIEGGARPGSFRSFTVPDVALFPGSSLALLVDDEGDTMIALVVRATETGAFHCIEVRFPASGVEARIGVDVALGRLPSEPVVSGVHYLNDAGRYRRREVVVGLGNGAVYAAAGNSELRQIEAGGRLTDPILFAPGKDTSYVLYEHDGGLALEPLSLR